VTRPLLIAVFELRRYLADRGELAFGILLPIALFALMYGTFSGGTSFNGTAYVVDNDGGPVTAEILERLGDIDGLKVEVLAEREATAKLDRAAILMAVVFPAGFSEAVSARVTSDAGDAPDAGDIGTVLTRQRGQGGDAGQIATGIVRAVSVQVASEFAARSAVGDALAGDGIAPGRIDETVARLLAESRENPAVGVASRTVGDGERDSDFVNRLMPGILVMFLTFAVTLGSQSIVQDRRLGTLERLTTTRLTLGQLFIGKFLSGLFRAMFQTLVLMSLGFTVLQVAGASEYFQVVVFCLLIAGAVSAIGLAIGALATSRDQAIWAGVVITMFMTIFGGTFFATSGTMDVVSRLTLNRYAIDALDAMISGGESLLDQGVEAAVMIGIAAVALAIARWGFRASVR
jgi:ABC-2 type transport system permease protein